MAHTLRICGKCGSSALSLDAERHEFTCAKCGHSWSPRTLRVFLSYGRDEHTELARRLARDLRSSRHEVWFDEEQLKPGCDWEASIEEGLNWAAQDTTSGRVVLLMTPHSVRRPNGYCLNEVSLAVLRDIDVVPVMVVWVEPPLSICRIQWLDMRDCVPVEDREAVYDRQYGKLLAALEQGKVDHEGHQARLLHFLKPLDFGVELAQHTQGFVGRQWLMEAYETWLVKEPVSRVLWLLGGPGVGKTAFASQLCCTRPEVRAYHLCCYNHEEQSDPRRCVMSLAYQLATQLPGFDARLRAMDLQDEIAKSAATMFHNLVVRPLSSLLAEPDGAIVVVIDGLDEATQDGRNELAEFLGTKFEMTPRWLRLVITSRSDQAVLGPLQHFIPFHIDMATGQNMADIKTYVERELKGWIQEPVRLRETCDTLMQNSEGSFLYAAHVITDLKDGRLRTDELGRLPPGLGRLFHELMLRHFPHRDEFDHDVRPIMEALAAALGPVPLSLMKRVLQIGYGRKGPSDPVIGALRALRLADPVLRRAEGYVRPFHTSLLEWLTDENVAGDYAINVVAGSRSLTETCWSEFCEDGPLSEYAQAHLPAHLIQLGRWSELLQMVKGRNALFIRRWRERGNTKQGIAVLCRLLENVHLCDADQAALTTHLAMFHTRRGEHDRAERRLREVLDRTSWRVARKARVVAMHTQGSLLFDQDDLRAATRCFRRALRLSTWLRPRYPDEAASNRNALATISIRKYQWRRAERFALQAMRDAAESSHLKRMIAALRLLAVALDETGQYEEARQHLATALEQCVSAPIGLEYIRLLSAVGWARYEDALRQGQSCGTAADAFQQAAELAQQSYCFYETLLSKVGLGWCSVVDGDVELAARAFSEVSSCLPEDRYYDLTALTGLGLGAVQLQRGECCSAMEHYRAVLAVARDHKFMESRAKALVGIGAIQWHSKCRLEAERSWSEARRSAQRKSPRASELIDLNIRLCQSKPNTPPR